MTKSMRIALALTLALGATISLSAPAAAQNNPEVKREVRRLVSQLDHKREHKRLQAIEKLGHLGKNAKSTLPRLMKILRKGKPTAQVTALRAVSRIAPDDAKVFAALSNVLKNRDSHYQLRKTAAFGLGQIALRVKVLRPTIVRLLQTELRAQRHGNLVDVTLATSLGRLGPDAFSAGPSLEHALLKSPFQDVKAAAFIAMARVSPADKDARMAQLIGDVRTGSLAKKARAFGQLRSMGKRATPALEALHAAAAADKPIFEQVAALGTLAAVAPANPASIALFVDAIRSDHYLLKPAGTKALNVLNRVHIKTAIEPLLTQLAKSEGEAKREVLATLRRVGPRHELVVARVLTILKGLTAQDSELVVYETLEAVRRGAPVTKSAGTHLVTLVNPKHPLYANRREVEVDFLIAHVLTTLSEVGIPEGSAQVVLQELKRDKPYVRPAVIRAIGALGSDGAPAVGQLVAMLEKGPIWTPILPFLHDSFPSVEAIRTLGRIGPAAKDAIPVLNGFANRKALEASEIGVLEAQAARRALSQIQG